MGLSRWTLVLTLALLSPHLADSQICAGSTSGVLPHPSDCTKYILCSAGGSTEKDCPTGEYFNPNVSACMISTAGAVCGNGAIPSPRPTALPNYCVLNHWVDGIFPHPYTCRTYIQCRNSVDTLIDCPGGQLYDPTYKTCVNQDLAKPCNDAHVNENLDSICNSAQADILFLLDSSSSMTNDNFALQRRFVINITNVFLVGGDDVHFSVIVFSDDALIKIPFSPQQTHGSLDTSIINLNYVGVSTFTNIALDLARNTGFSPANGARIGTKKIAVVITDGLSNNTAWTLSSAADLKATDVHLFSVGVGQFKRDELVGIATSPEDVFSTDSFDRLHELEKSLAAEICNKATDSFCHNTSYADVIIVMDSSASIGYNNWLIQLDFAANLTRNFPVGPQDMRFAAISYGTVVQKLFDLSTYTLGSQIRGAINQAPYLSESTNTAAALRFITDNGMFNVGAGGRSDAAKIVIVMTDGQSTQPADTQKEASNLLAKGIHMIAIGIGNAVDFREIISMSSSAADRFHSTGYDVLDRLKDEVRNRTCNPHSQGTGQDVSNFCLQQNWVNGIHAYPFDCTKFIECTFLHTAILHCPPGLLYDPILQTCTYPKDAVSCLDHNDYVYLPGQSTPSPHVTPALDVSAICVTNHWTNGDYPHPTDCSYFLRCENGLTRAIPCQAGTLFDPGQKGCVAYYLAQPCNDVRTTQAPYTTQRLGTTTSPRYNLTNICALYKLPDGIYPDPGSCVHFIECTNEDTKHLICPEGLHFNSRSLYCDDVHLIDCNDNYNFQFEHIVAG